MCGGGGGTSFVRERKGSMCKINCFGMETLTGHPSTDAKAQVRTGINGEGQDYLHGGNRMLLQVRTEE